MIEHAAIRLLTGTLAGALAFTSVDTSAAEWKRIGKTPEIAKVNLDISSISVDTSGDEPIVSAWFQMIYKKHRRLVIHERLNLFEIKCSSRQWNLRRTVTYGRSKKLIENLYFDTPEFEPVVPSSIAETELNAACRFAGLA
jgi:hypothetical protein